MNKGIVKPSVAKGYVPFKATGIEKGMTLPNARRSFRLIKRTEDRKKVFEGSATAAALRHKEGRIS